MKDDKSLEDSEKQKYRDWQEIDLRFKIRYIKNVLSWQVLGVYDMYVLGM